MQYGTAFDPFFFGPHHVQMRTMRSVLQRLMANKGWNAYVLADESGVRQPTIQRFLAGTHNELRESTVRKLAGAFGVTEEQFRGLAPIDELEGRSAPRRKIWIAFQRLTPHHQAAVEAVIETLLAAQAPEDQTVPVSDEADTEQAPRSS